MLAWCGTNTSMSARVSPASLMASAAIGASAVTAQRNTSCPAIRSVGAGVDGSSRTAAHEYGWAIAAALDPSDPHRTGPDAGLRGRTDDDRAGAVPEQERRAAVGRVDDVGHPLDPDHHDVLGAAGPDRVGGDRERVAEAGAAGAGVQRAGVGWPRSGTRPRPPAAAPGAGCSSW